MVRVVGGEVSKPGAWLFGVALTTDSGLQYCGATLIRDSWVLTAGHCDVRVGEIAVIGRVDLRTDEGESIAISEVRTHELFVNVERGYDVAVARLVRPSKGKLATLPAAGALPAAGVAVGIGYGATSEGGQTSPVLREVKLPILTDTECLLAYPSAPVTALCAGYAHDGGKDTCQGDSGGGLFLGSTVIGITSYGEGCGREPGVYTNVAMVYDFIVSCTAE
jgi:secreted trypsin-like serine protease